MTYFPIHLYPQNCYNTYLLISFSYTKNLATISNYIIAALVVRFWHNHHLLANIEGDDVV